MRFGVNTWVWVAPLTGNDIETLMPRVAAMGFDLIELPIEVPNSFDYARAAELSRRYGLGVSTCAVIGADRDLIHPDGNVRAHGVEYVRHCIDAAQILGSDRVVGPLYSGVGRLWRQTATERDQDNARLVEQLRPLAEYAAERQVVLCVEPLNRFETSFINVAEQAIELVDRVAHPGFQLMLDTFHMNIEERSLGDAIRASGPRLRHLHACENDRGAPGSGHLLWNDIAAALHDIGYDGPVVIESFTDKVQSIARAAAIWRPLAPSQDALARDGLAFLRGMLAESAPACDL
jgi:D-psicose/D-tagatose/L-ribulose 3-epimerase